MRVLDLYKDTALSEFVLLLSQKIPEVDKERAHRLAKSAIRYYRGSKERRSATRPLQDMERQWYDSLESGQPAYGLYSRLDMFSDLWACWVVYSRKYLLAIQKHDTTLQKSIVEDLGDVRSVADLGCGFGYTTAALKEMFPAADVQGTNVADTQQFRIGNIIGQQYGFRVVSKPDRRADLVFASEYFEHIINPVEHLREVLRVCEPKALIIANTFSARSLGHFDVYRDDDRLVKSKDMGRLFNRALRDQGYENVQTRLWNKRPAYWRQRAKASK